MEYVTFKENGTVQEEIKKSKFICHVKMCIRDRTTTMHHLSPLSRRKTLSLERSEGCQDLVRFFALLRIKPHAPPLVRAPVNSFEFQPCGRTPQVECLLR